jgi:hypothetical protein
MSPTENITSNQKTTFLKNLRNLLVPTLSKETPQVHASHLFMNDSALQYNKRGWALGLGPSPDHCTVLALEVTYYHNSSIQAVTMFLASTEYKPGPPNSTARRVGLFYRIPFEIKLYLFVEPFT